MMSNLLRELHRLADERERRAVARVAAQLEALVGDASVEISGTSVIVRGPRLGRKWLNEPALRFFGQCK